MKKLTARQLTKVYENMRAEKNSKKVTKKEYETIRTLLVNHGQKMSVIAVRSGRSRQTVLRVKNSPTYQDFLNEIRRWSKKVVKATTKTATFTAPDLKAGRSDALSRLTKRIAEERALKEEMKYLHNLQVRYLNGSMIHMHSIEDHLNQQKTNARLQIMALWSIFAVLALLALKYV
jgi:hypothetical protein